MRWAILAGAAGLVLAGCMQTASIEKAERVALTKRQVAQIKATVTRDFNDPGSAQFRNIRAVNVTLDGGAQEVRVCGEVNGKNLYGAYVGFSGFGGTLENGTFRQRDFYAPCESW